MHHNQIAATAVIESFPLREIFYALISYHLERNSGLKRSAYRFRGISSEPES